MKTKQEKLGLAPASLLSKAEKHRRNLQIFEQIREDHYERFHGPRGEAKSLEILGRVQLVPLEEITNNSNLPDDDRLEPTEDEARVLEESMRHEGLKSPVVVADCQGRYELCQGFPQVATARKLGWGSVPAIVLPDHTSPRSQCWAYITDRLARPAMHSYEVARSAETMRDHFNVPCEEFARRTGLAPHYVRNLLQAIDHLPPLLMQKWRERRPIPFDYFFLWSRLSPEKAIASFNEYVGLHPRHRAARGAKKRQRPN